MRTREALADPESSTVVEWRSLRCLVYSSMVCNLGGFGGRLYFLSVADVLIVVTLDRDKTP